MKKYQSAGVYIMLILVLALFTASFFVEKKEVVKKVSYSVLMNMVQKDEIKSVSIENNKVTAVPKKTADDAPANYVTVIPMNDSNFIPRLEEKGIDIKVENPAETNQWINFLGSLILPLLLLVGLIFFFKAIQSGGSQAMSFGKSKAKLMMDNKVKITFADVAGIDEEKQELMEIVDFLKNGEKYVSLGAKIPKGVLLVGAPGTGKTLMAKAVAGEAGVPFFSISGSDFVEMFVGVGASRVRDLFEQAKKHSPCIVFIDEIDAVGRQRGAGLGGGHDEREQTLNQLLVEMDGFDENTNIIIIAATNRPDILDNALLRPGRFDRQIAVSSPDINGREQILKVHAKNKPFADDVDLKVLAKRTPGFTGADLQNLLNEAALYAARLGKDKITMEEVDVSIDKVIAGVEKKSKVMTEEDKEVTAYHEVGHALVSKLVKDSDVLHKVSIIPRGMALGLTWYKPKDESVSTKKTKLLARITTALGGRAAEEIVFGKENICTGASQDIETVTNIARKMVTAWGMSEKMGTITYGKSNEHVFMGRDFGHSKDYSEDVAAAIDAEVKEIVDTQYNLAKTLLSENRDILEAVVKVLLEKETLDDSEVVEIMEDVKALRHTESE
ncbi:MAG: ATP-dependent zinc metalloprotease FtsH [Candidatus Gastranaerophilales bacterium]|nr:ATP-dependent zinc metalloprotease FtsH [Candidatus Gastranaerophilales bacterium]